MLTRLLLGLRLDGVAYSRCRFGPPWAVRFPAQAEACFHFVASGGCWLHTPATGWLRLAPGDAVLLPRGSAHVLASAPDQPVTDLAALQRVPITEQLCLLRCAAPREPLAANAANAADATGAAAAADGAGGAQPPEDQQAGAADDAGADVVFCGSMRFNLDPLHPLLAMLPELMRAGELAQRDPGVPTLLAAMDREVALNRIGSCGILARLADVLAASIIRAWVECASDQATGWIAAMHCPRIGKVLAAIHAEPERDWSVPALASIMGASRSRFADTFTRTVGDTPARYVAKVKMFQARHWIAQEGMRVAVAADRLGYESEAAFSRAFKRVVGLAPSAVRAAA